MSKILTETPITTRAARAYLTPGTYWRLLDPDVHLGYRKAKRGGRWLVRAYDGQGGYQQQTIGTADDVIPEGNLDFDAACKVARHTIVANRRAAAAEAAGPVVTVRLAIERYVARRNARASARAGRPVKSDAESRLEVHVLSDTGLADTPLHALSEETLRHWRDSLCSGKATTRQRLVADFKAALNRAAEDGRRILPSDLPVIIKYGLRAPEHDLAAPVAPVARDNQILSDNEVRWIVQASRQIDIEQGWDGDLYRMMIVLAATGARFSQVRRLAVHDLQLIASRLMIPSSAKGRKKEARYIPVPVGADVLEALRPVSAGRGKAEPLLERWHHVQSGRGKWKREMRRPWRASYEITKVFQEVASLAGVPGLSAYCLRHSSIIRHLRVGTPIRLVAALHDTSVEMIEKHYSHWIADGLEEIAARAVVPLLPADPGEATVLPFPAPMVREVA
jgi:integrase